MNFSECSQAHALTFCPWLLALFNEVGVTENVWPTSKNTYHLTLYRKSLPTSSLNTLAVSSTDCSISAIDVLFFLGRFAACSGSKASVLSALHHPPKLTGVSSYPLGRQAFARVPRQRLILVLTLVTFSLFVLHHQEAFGSCPLFRQGNWLYIIRLRHVYWLAVAVWEIIPNFTAQPNKHLQPHGVYG